MPELLNIGDPVTVVALHDPLHTIIKFVIAAGVDGFSAALCDAARARGYQIGDEGITWIRGVHPPKSCDVQALLAAYALVQPFNRIEIDAVR